MYRILVNCKKYTIMKDFFMQTESQFDCLSTSYFWGDITAHFKHFNPEAYVCFVDAEDTEFISQVMTLRNNANYNNCPIVVVSDKETIDILKSAVANFVDIFIERPIAAVKIMATIIHYLRGQNEAEAELGMGDDLAGLEVGEVKKKRVMVIDDDRTVLKLLKGALDGVYEVTPMANGITATKFFESHTCDLILLDYEMPGANGPQVFRILRNMEAAANVPIVFLTGVADKAKIQEVLALRPQGYLLKPVDVEKVHRTIESLIGN